MLSLESQPLHSNSQSSVQRTSEEDGEVFDLDGFIDDLSAFEVDMLLNGGEAAIRNAVFNPPAADNELQKEQKLLDASRGSVGAANATSAVFLHVYDLNEGFQKANELLSFSWESLAVGGAFHVGVEVFGSEWSFGSSGVRSALPRAAEGHVYNSSVCLGATKLDQIGFAAMLGQLCRQWRGAQYHLLARNCCSFAMELCLRLGTEPVPAWITRLPRILDAGRKALKEGQKAGNSAIDKFRMAARAISRANTPTRSESKPQRHSKARQIASGASQSPTNKIPRPLKPPRPPLISNVERHSSSNKENAQFTRSISSPCAEMLLEPRKPPEVLPPVLHSLSFAGLEDERGMENAVDVSAEPLVTRIPSTASFVSVCSARPAPLQIRCRSPAEHALSLRRNASRGAMNVLERRSMMFVLPTRCRNRPERSLKQKISVGAPLCPSPMCMRIPSSGCFSPAYPAFMLQTTGGTSSPAYAPPEGFRWQAPEF